MRAVTPATATPIVTERGGGRRPLSPWAGLCASFLRGAANQSRSPSGCPPTGRGPAAILSLSAGRTLAF